MSTFDPKINLNADALPTRAGKSINARPKVKSGNDKLEYRTYSKIEGTSTKLSIDFYQRMEPTMEASAIA